MKRGERTIKIAFDGSTGEIVNADDLFNEKKDGFQIRKQFHENKINLSCCECEQELNISKSKYERLYFKHKPYHDFCFLTDSEMSPKEYEDYINILVGKESERHKFLKNRIGTLLSKAEGVDISTISIDNKFIIRNEEKRKPDVYCKYFDKEIVFEIQLSQLSLSYILNRYNFYKKNGIYLIWILDNFDIKNQGTLEKDIKYLTHYQNFFKLDESSDSFKLICDFKKAYIKDDKEVCLKWFNKSVSINELKFDEEIFQVYYHNLKDDENKRKVELESLKENLKKIKLEEEVLKKKVNNKNQVQKIINSISKNVEKVRADYSDIFWDIYNLDEEGINVLNQELNLVNRKRKGIPILNYWIKNTNLRHDYFLEFILKCESININLENFSGLSLLEEIVLNEKLENLIFIKLLLKRGYKVTNSDEETYLKHEKHNPDFFIIYKICSRLKNKNLIDSVFKHYQLLFTIESARLKKIVGYRLPNWKALANNAIYHHGKYWEYIEYSFKKYGVWNMIIELDKNKVFQSKLKEFYNCMPEQEFDFDDVFRDLYIDELQFIEHLDS